MRVLLFHLVVSSRLLCLLDRMSINTCKSIDACWYLTIWTNLFGFLMSASQVYFVYMCDTCCATVVTYNESDGTSMYFFQSVEYYFGYVGSRL